MEKAPFLPMTKEEMDLLGWEQADFIIITGDAYVDHPSFGAAIIGRVLEDEGYRVGMISQPDWRDATAFKRLGRPRLGWLVTAGNLDSMVNHYTAAKKPRSTDAYSPGGKAGLRPDRATLVYAQRCRQAYKEPPVILGGIEASLRRFAHYDYWEDRVRRSFLVDARADVLVYGMGERAIRELAAQIVDRRKGQSSDDKRLPLGFDIPGCCYLLESLEPLQGKSYLDLPSYEQVTQDKKSFSKAFSIQEREQNPYLGKALVQAHGQQYLVQNPPAKPLATLELDKIYELPFARTYHPIYKKPVPALEEVEFSLAAQRGCFGGCSFCALTFHQGRIIQPRSQESLLREARQMIQSPNFKGYIHDVGGPTANFRIPACAKQEKAGPCSHQQCMHPNPCTRLDIDHGRYLALLRELRKLPGIKKVFVRSGLRYDYLMADKSPSAKQFLKELCEHHVSGQLKVAPEHFSDRVLGLMGKPSKSVYEKFREAFHRTNKQIGKEQYLVPYLMSSHPGSSLEEAIEMAEVIRDWGYTPEQVQDFIPTPGSRSTCMYYTGIDPNTLESVHVPRSPVEKAMQRALLQFRRPENYEMVYKALQKSGRQDLIGFHTKALVRPRSVVNQRRRKAETEPSKPEKKYTPPSQMKKASERAAKFKKRG